MHPLQLSAVVKSELWADLHLNSPGAHVPCLYLRLVWTSVQKLDTLLHLFLDILIASWRIEYHVALPPICFYYVI